MIKNEKNVIWIVLGFLIMIGYLIYMLVGYIFNIPVPNSDKRTEAQSSGQASGLETSEEDIKEKTGILGSAAYNNNGEALGSLYDLYVHPDTGSIEWASLDITGKDQSSLVMLPQNMLASISDNSPVIIDISKNDLMEYPVQQRHEKDLIGFISLRDLSETPILDSDNAKQIGTISKLTYKNGAIDMVYFEVINPLTQHPNDQYFMIPFQYLHFINVDNPYNQGVKVTLTERQAGAIDAYATIRGSR